MKYLVNKNEAKAQGWCILDFSSCDKRCDLYNPCTMFSQPCNGYCSNFSMCIVGKPGMAMNNKGGTKSNYK